MGNRLKKETKKQNQNTTETFFSFHPWGKKVYGLYQDSNKQKNVQARQGINNIISTVITLTVLGFISWNYKFPVVALASIVYCIIGTATAFWNIHNGKNRNIWMTSAAIHTIASIIMGVIIILIQSNAT